MELGRILKGGLRALLFSVVNTQHGSRAEGWPLCLSLEVAFRYESDSQLWRLIMEAVSQRTFQGSPGSSQTASKQDWCQGCVEGLLSGAVIGHGDWGSPMAEQWWHDSSPENYMERREMENTRPLFNQSCLLEIHNEYRKRKAGAALLFIHSAAVWSTVHFVFYRLLLDVLNSTGSQWFTNKPAKIMA